MNPEQTPSEEVSHPEHLAQLAAGLRTRELHLEQREQELKRGASAHAEIALQNAELRAANEKLVLATLAADELREQAEVMRRRQDEFLAMLSHELRNPLAPIRMAVEVIARKAGPEVPPRSLDIIRRQVSNIVRLLDELLDVSRVTQGKITLKRRTVELSSVVSMAVETCGDAFLKRRQRFTTVLPQHLVYLVGDTVRLGQVIANLLLNASKYTRDEGEINLSAEVKGESVEIRVQDNGAGISAAALPHIFELFAQDERTLSRAQGGLGIGLTVVKKLVELHAGTVTAFSAGRGAGSEFVVTLPTVAHPEESMSETGAPPSGFATSARVLVIEDNVDAAEVLSELLRAQGHDVEVAIDGTSGLELFDRWQPQVILCDIGLPGMDGYAVAELMRAKAHVPKPALIALTGYGTAQDVARALASGFDYHLVKPADPQSLLRLVETAVNNKNWAENRWMNSSHGSLVDLARPGSSS